MSSSFIAPLTPVIKKYLDVQTGPSFNAGQKQTSRPSSRANNRVMEAGHRPASSTLSKAPFRPRIDNPAHSTRQRPAVHEPQTVVDTRAPRQRTISQMHRDHPQSRTLQIKAQSSSAAQRCLVPPSAPTRQAAQHLPPAAVRVLPGPNATSSSGPQRPPPVQLKLNPASDRLKVTGNGAKRVPLPSAPANEPTREQVTAATDSGGRTDDTVDKPRSKLPSRNAEAVAPGKLVVNRKAPEGIRSTSSSTKPVNKTGPVVVHRSHQRTLKGETSNASKIPPLRRPARNTQKSTRLPVKAERKETSPILIPLPPSPSTTPTEIPLPVSPDHELRPIDSETQDKPVVGNPSETTELAGRRLSCAEPCQEQGDVDSPNTPITTLLSSIQRGFLFTPSSPLSPPQNYLPAPGNLPEKRQHPIIASDFTKGLLVVAPFCIPLENNTAADDLDRHALRDLN